MIDPEPQDEDRQKGDLGRREAEGDQRIEQPAREANARHEEADGDAEQECKRKARGRPVETDQEGLEQIPCERHRHDPLDDCRQRWQEHRSDIAQLRRPFPD
ncbi:MAG: hypothetical protein QOJ15_11771, partial [Bradyrhizobium sp.]|nr:hypothetical protein [Bradyrhizobium sp.]